MRFSGTPPPLLSMPGIVSDVVTENRHELMIANFGDEHITAVESLSPSSMEFIEMTLEDAFIACMRGSKTTAARVSCSFNARFADEERQGSTDLRNNHHDRCSREKKQLRVIW